MKDKIKVYLKGKLQGISEAYINEVAEHYGKIIKDEGEFENTFTDSIIDVLKLNASFFQKEGDRRATDAAKTAVESFRTKYGIDENGKSIRINEPNPTPPEIPEWFSEFKKEHENLKLELEKFNNEKKVTDLKSKVLGHEKIKSIPKSFLKGRNIDVKSEEEIDTIVSEIESDYNQFQQELVENDVIIDIPISPEGKAKEDEIVAKEIAESRNNSQATNAGSKGKQI